MQNKNKESIAIRDGDKSSAWPLIHGAVRGR